MPSPPFRLELVHSTYVQYLECMYLVHTHADFTSAFVDWSFSYDAYLVLCFVRFFPEVFFHIRVVGACPVTTHRILGDELM